MTLRAATRPRGFTLLELLLVVAIIALASAVAALALPDPAATRLEREAVRLAAILESARVLARAQGVPVRWRPGPPPATPAAGTEPVTPDDFHFEGLPEGHDLPRRWSDADLSGRIAVQIEGRPARLVLGPEPVIPPQRVTLQLDERRVTLATDGLAPFVVVPDEAPAR